MGKEAERLEEEIGRAFADRPYPGDENIVVEEYRYSGSEAEATWKRLSKKHWREVLTIGRELDLRDDLACLTLEGFVYYLPAFLTLSLELDNPLGPDEFLVYHLWSRREEVAPALDSSEGRVVVRVLELLAREYQRRSYVGNEVHQALVFYRSYFTENH